MQELARRLVVGHKSDGRAVYDEAAKAELVAACGQPGMSVSRLARECRVKANQLSVVDWRRQLLDRAADVFGGASAPSEPPVDLKALHAKIGQLALENDSLEGALTKAGLLSARR
jgi:transposase-like protein